MRNLVLNEKQRAFYDQQANDRNMAAKYTVDEFAALNRWSAIPTRQEILQAPFVPKPSDYQFLQAVKQWALYNLKDPSSAIYNQIHSPRKGWASKPISTNTLKATRMVPETEKVPRESVYGWISKIGINSKNSYGGYVGMREFVFIWQKGGKLSTANDGNNYGSDYWYFGYNTDSVERPFPPR